MFKKIVAFFNKKEVPKIPKVISDTLEKSKHINIDLGCGESVREGFIGIDKRPLPNVQIVHDIEVFPYPVPDGIVNTVVMSHVWEHIKPWLTIDLMNEVWRILKVGGKIALSFPYGVSSGFLQDPTHCNASNETTWEYFDPNCYMYNIYKPKPFEIEHRSWQVEGFMEVVLRKISEEEGLERNKKFVAQLIEQQKGQQNG